MSSLIGELQRRNVFRVAIVYVVVAWIILQLGEILLPAFGIPDWGLRFIFIVLILGLPLALIFAWAFEMTPEGIKREKDVDRSVSMTPQTGRKLDRTIIVVLALAVVFLVLDNYVLDRREPVPTAVTGADDALYSIAVLPFVNMSNDPDNEYFSEGLSEELLNVLAQIQDFKVAGRTSSFAFKGQAQDLREIGDKLGVNTVLEGSVRKAGDQVRITAQLVKVDDGFHLWSATYDRTLENIFEVQGEIATAVVSALKQTLLGEEDLAILDSKPTDNVDAYNHYLRGRFYIRDRTREQLQKAQEAFQLAATLDPDFALAYSGLADSYMLQVDYGFRNYEDVQPLAQAAIDRAMAIDDQVSEVWASQGLIHSEAPTTADNKAERAALQRAVELNPNNAQAWAWLGNSATLAETRQRIKELERAFELDPLHPVIMANLSTQYSVTGQYERAHALAQQIVEIEPELWRGYWDVGLSYWFEGEWDEAVLWYLKALKRDADNNSILGSIGGVFTDLGALDQAQDYTQRALRLNQQNRGLNASMAYLEYLKGQPDAGLARLRGLLESAPADDFLLANIAYLDLLTGNEERAREEYRQVMMPDEGSEDWRITDGNFFFATWYAFTLNNAGERDEAEALSRAVVDWTAAIEGAGVHTWWIYIARALAHGAIGQRPEAVAAMRAAAETGWPGMTWIEHDPVFNTLRDDLGYMALMDDLRAKRQAQLETLRAEGI
jgi:TolB-like protein/Flp pilus assembly protein TadD